MAKKLRTPRLEDLKPAPRNPRGIDELGLEGLTYSLKEFGDISGFTWNQRTGHMVTGHQRLRALQEEHGDQLKIRAGAIVTPDGEAFRLRVVDWPEDKEMAANVAANNYQTGGYFTDDIAPLLDEIKEANPEAHGSLLFEELKQDLGYNDEAAGTETAADEAEPPPPAKPITKPGDTWILGDHRLHCGDAKLRRSFDRLMVGAELAHLVFTDPPYGVSYEDEAGKGMIAGDDLRDDDLVRLVRQSLKWAARVTIPDAAFYIWHASDTRDDFSTAMAAAGLTPRQYIIWIKPSFALGRADYQQGHEPCFYAGKAGETLRWFGDRSQSTIWRIGASTPDGSLAYDLADGLKISDGHGNTLAIRDRAPGGKRIRKVRLEEGEQILITKAGEGTADAWHVARDPFKEYKHPTQKPIGLAAIAIRNSTEKGELVLDPFGGSGSTLLAGDRAGRQVRTLELDPRYCDVIVERWQDKTGGKARRSS